MSNPNSISKSYRYGFVLGLTTFASYMQSPRHTRSHTRSTASHSTAATSSTIPRPTSPFSSDEINRLFDVPTPTLTLTPSASPTMSNNDRDSPPHQLPNLPPMDPQFQQALVAFFQAMTAQVQAGQAQAPAAQPA